MAVFAFFLLFAGVALAFRLGAGGMDAERVERYIQSQGGELVGRSWDPFGPGWFGEKNARIYAIEYRDRDGRLHRAHVKTSMMSGVYLTNDRVVEEAPAESLEGEKQKLLARLAEIERVQRGC